MTDHAHWSAFDENLETLELNRLQFMLRVGERVHDEDLHRLSRLSWAAGHGDADSFLTDFGTDGSNDTPEAAAHRELFENFQENEYWSAIDRSERILIDAAGGSGTTREIARKVCDLMRDAYEKGRAHRIDQDTASTPAP